MKTFFRSLPFIGLALLSAGGAAAQDFDMAREGVVPAGPGRAVYVQPETTVSIELTLRRETVRRGPYARYAQKLLGVVAPLADKTVWSIVGARLAVRPCDPETTVAPERTAGTEYVSHVNDPDDFVKVGIDRLAVSQLPTEEAARRAAETIFTLRRRRFDLVTGEAGERVFGGGLQAALDEMARMEQEYLALFLGKTTVETVRVRVESVPVADRETFVPCRFSDERGIVPTDDLSGRPLLLELQPEGEIPEAVATLGAQRKSRGETAVYRVARPMLCRFSDGQRELAREVLPVYQYGTSVSLPVELLESK